MSWCQDLLAFGDSCFRVANVDATYQTMVYTDASFRRCHSFSTSLFIFVD